MAPPTGNRHSVTRTSAVSTWTVPRAGIGSDHFVALEGGEVFVVQAEELAVDLGVVLTEQRGRRHLDRRGRHANRAAEHGHLAPRGVLDVHDHAALAQMLVV